VRDSASTYPPSLTVLTEVFCHLLYARLGWSLETTYVLALIRLLHSTAAIGLIRPWSKRKSVMLPSQGVIPAGCLRCGELFHVMFTPSYSVLSVYPLLVLFQVNRMRGYFPLI
jgi:hypothetical protein